MFQQHTFSSNLMLQMLMNVSMNLVKINERGLTCDKTKTNMPNIILNRKNMKFFYYSSILSTNKGTFFTIISCPFPERKVRGWLFAAASLNQCVVQCLERCSASDRSTAMISQPVRIGYGISLHVILSRQLLRSFNFLVLHNGLLSLYKYTNISGPATTIIYSLCPKL